MNEKMSVMILKVIEPAPQWLRHELGSRDAAAHGSAGETLAAMISNALANGTAATQEG